MGAPGRACVRSRGVQIGANLCIHTEPEYPEELAHFLFTNPIEPESQELHKVRMRRVGATAVVRVAGSAPAFNAHIYIYIYIYVYILEHRCVATASLCLASGPGHGRCMPSFVVPLVCRQVLVVLDNADALFDGKGCEVGHRLVELLSSMCCARRHLRLLLTSEQSLLRETNIRFRSGTEKVGEGGGG